MKMSLLYEEFNGDLDRGKNTHRLQRLREAAVTIT